MIGRRAEFKTPPLSRKASQDQRRLKALEEQKKRREHQIDAARNIDLFSALSISANDEDEDDEDGSPGPSVVPSGVGAFVSLLQPSASTRLPVTPEAAGGDARASTPTRSNKGKRKADPLQNKSSLKAKKPSKFANKCMYAELLELKDDQWSMEEGDNVDDGLPSDLEDNWVALAPVPKGKRCLAVSYQSSGTGGEVSITPTYLHSRLKGKKIMKFPSPLPPNSILDCILDARWEENGLIHVLDIIRWKGTDFVDCEAEFRFWWRDARISELGHLPLPARLPPSADKPLAIFAYPTSFVPVPYHTPPLPLLIFLQTVVPHARTQREIEIFLPPLREEGMDVEVEDEFGRIPQFDQMAAEVSQSTASIAFPTPPATVRAQVATDGLLLYASQGCYTPGESPLSCWVPATNGNQGVTLDLFEKLIQKRVATSQDNQTETMDLQ